MSAVEHHPYVGTRRDPLTLDRRIEIHNKTQFEMKMEYNLSGEEKHLTAQIDAYFFFPPMLGVGPEIYSKNLFFNDVQAYMRFRTPVMTWEEIVDPNNPDSPLTKLTKHLSDIKKPISKKTVRSCVQEARLFGCLMKSFCRDEREHLQDLILKGKANPEGDKLALYSQELREFLQDVDEMLIRFRAIRKSYHATWQELKGNFLKEICYTLDAVDEFMSKHLEKNLCEMIHWSEKALSVPEAQVLFAVVAEKLRDERSYRKTEGFLFPEVEATGDQEGYLFRIRFLKQFISNVLYLNVREIKPEQRIRSIIGVTFAGLAAMFATMVAVALGSVFSITSAPFIAIGVIAYILKDRIKEWGKSTFTGVVMNRLPDLNHRIIDQTQDKEGVVVGYCRESMRYLNRNRVPPEILAIRQIRRFTQKEREDEYQPIIHYRKVIHLNAKQILESHTRRININDIIRFNVARFLTRMDEAAVPIHTLSPEGNRIVTKEGSKVYYLNVVLCYTSRQKTNGNALNATNKVLTRNEKIRIVLTKQGIKRIDDVVHLAPLSQIIEQNAEHFPNEIWSAPLPRGE